MEKSPGFTFTDEGIPYLEVDPPHWAARGLPYILILLFLTFLISSIVIQIPETISVPFVLVPVHGADPVRAPETGIVREVHVMAAQAVTKGQSLFVIHSQSTGDRSADLRSLQMEIKGSEEKLGSARTKYESQQMSDREEDKRLKSRISYLGRMIEMKSKELAVTKELLLSYEKLYKDGIMNRTEFANHQLETDKIELDLEEMKTERNEASSNLEKLHHESSGRAAEFQALEQNIKEERDKSAFHSEALTKELVNSRQGELSVPAPCDGAVLDLRTQAPGAVVQEGETLCELACSGQNLQAELKVPEQGMARMKIAAPIRSRLRRRFRTAPDRWRGSRHRVRKCRERAERIRRG